MLLAVAGFPCIRLFDTVAATRPSSPGTPNPTASTTNEPPLHVFEGCSTQQSNVIAVGFEEANGNGSGSNTLRWLWSVCQDGTIRVWDLLRAPEYPCVKEILLRSVQITAATLHPDQRSLIVGDSKGTLRHVDLSLSSGSNKPQEMVVCPGTPVRSVAISYHGLLMAALDHQGRLHLYQQTTSGAEASWRHLCSIEAHQTYAIKCIFSPDSTLLLTTAADATAKLWRLHHHGDQLEVELAQTLSGHAKWVWDAAFSADSVYIVTASSDNTARLWDALTAETIAIYVGHSKAITSLALNDLSL